jgi:CheY-like chemotaxis protein/PAS domain-containing protein
MGSTLRKRILIGYGITLALMAVVLVWAVVNLIGLGQASDAILRENYKSILAAENMIDAIERQDSATLLVMLDYGADGLAQFRVTNMNPQAGRILSVDPEAIAERHFLEVVKSEPLFDLIRQTAESGQPPKVEEGENILSFGEGESAKHYMFGITPVVSKGGGMVGVVLLLRDVTRLRELDRMKSEFVMTASHELKTPLQSLGMSIELLREGAAAKLDDKQNQMDLKLPGMDGMEVLRRVREARPDIKIIVITAYGTIKSAVEAMQLGAVDVIQKPFAPREIRDLVRKVIDRDTLAADKAGS